MFYSSKPNPTISIPQESADEFIANWVFKLKSGHYMQGQGEYLSTTRKYDVIGIALADFEALTPQLHGLLAAEIVAKFSGFSLTFIAELIITNDRGANFNQLAGMIIRERERIHSEQKKNCKEA